MPEPPWGWSQPSPLPDEEDLDLEFGAADVLELREFREAPLGWCPSCDRPVRWTCPGCGSPS